MRSFGCLKVAIFGPGFFLPLMLVPYYQSFFFGIGSKKVPFFFSCSLGTFGTLCLFALAPKGCQAPKGSRDRQERGFRICVATIHEGACTWLI